MTLGASWPAAGTEYLVLKLLLLLLLLLLLRLVLT